jgi:hypothetical protein
MTTTSFIVEILVVGSIGSIWFLLFFFGFSLADPKDVIDVLVKLKEWSGLITIGVIGLIYQLGWLINGFSYGILYPCFGKRMKESIFKKKQLNYNIVRGLVYQKASDKVRSDLDMERSIIRISRSGVFNFGLISIALLINGSSFIKFAPVTVVLFIGCSFQWYYRFTRYYVRMIDFYEVIQKELHSNSTQKKSIKKESSIDVE